MIRVGTRVFPKVRRGVSPARFRFRSGIGTHDRDHEMIVFEVEHSWDWDVWGSGNRKGARKATGMDKRAGRGSQVGGKGS